MGAVGTAPSASDFSEEDFSEMLGRLGEYAAGCADEGIRAVHAIDAFRWEIVKHAMMAAGCLARGDRSLLSSLVVISEGFAVQRLLPVDTILLAGAVDLAMRAGGAAVDGGRFEEAGDEAVDAAMGYVGNVERVDGELVERYLSVLRRVVKAAAAGYLPRA